MYPRLPQTAYVIEDDLKPLKLLLSLPSARVIGVHHHVLS